MKGKPSKNKIAGLIIVILGLSIIAYPLLLLFISDLGLTDGVRDYARVLEGIPSEEKVEMEEEILRYNENLNPHGESMVDPFINSTYVPADPLEDFDFDKEFGYVVIPKLGERLPLYLGATREHLKSGLAQIDGTSIPWGGVGTRSVIAGHRGYYDRTMLLNIDQLEAGDRIYIYAMGKRLVYEVYDWEVIAPSENEKLAPIQGEDVVTLLSCHPYPRNNRRILVNAMRTEEAVPKELLAGEDDFVGALQEDASSQETGFTVLAIKWGLRIALGLVVILILICLVKLGRLLKGRRTFEDR